METAETSNKKQNSRDINAETGEKETFSENFEQLKAEAKEYAHLHVSFWKMHVIEKMTILGIHVISAFVLIIILDVVLFFLGMAFGFWFGEITGSNSLGFLVAALIFIVLQIIIFVFRRKLFSGIIVKKLKDAFFDD